MGLDDPASLNPSWKLTGTIQKYDKFGKVVQTKPPLSCPATIIYRSDIGLPMGSVTNANFLECGVFTCDYDLSATYRAILILITGGRRHLAVLSEYNFAFWREISPNNEFLGYYPYL